MKSFISVKAVLVHKSIKMTVIYKERQLKKDHILSVTNSHFIVIGNFQLANMGFMVVCTLSSPPKGGLGGEI